MNFPEKIFRSFRFCYRGTYFGHLQCSRKRPNEPSILVAHHRRAGCVIINGVVFDRISRETDPKTCLFNSSSASKPNIGSDRPVVAGSNIPGTITGSQGDRAYTAWKELACLAGV